MQRCLYVLFLLLFFSISHAEEDFIEQASCEEFSLDFPEGAVSKKLEPPKKQKIPEASFAAMETLHAEPSSIFMGKVNMITGAFVEAQTDLVVPGLQPIVIQRFYSSSEDITGYTRNSLFQGWHLNHASKTSIYDDFQSNTSTAILDEGGSQTLFEGRYQKEIGFFFALKNTMFEGGLTNTGGGVISGKTNVRNIQVQRDGKDVSVILGSGAIRCYSKVHGFYVPDEYQLTTERQPSGNHLSYHYRPIHRNLHFSKIEARNNGYGVVSSTVFNYDMSKNNPKMEIYSSDNRRVTYHFFKLINGNFVLNQVDRSDGPCEKYTYACDGLMIRKDLPEDRFLEVRYFTDKDFTPRHRAFKRVKYLASPSGTGTSSVITHKFHYKFEERDGKLVSGVSGVYDIYNNHIDYAYDSCHRLTSISRFSPDRGLISKEKLYWGKEGSNLEGNLVSRTLRDASGNIHFLRNFRYDNHGNVLVEKLFGNLTGKNTTPIVIIHNGIPQKNGCEHYRKEFTYSNNGYNLLLSEEDSRTKTVYEYCLNKDLVKSKFLQVNGKIVYREFFFYDENTSCLVMKTTDDGSSRDPNDFTGATQRINTYIQNTQTMPIGLPEVIEERYVDLRNGYEGSLKKVVNNYTTDGKLFREDHFDHYGAYRFSNFWDYDDKGNVIRERNALSQVIEREYDPNNNCVKKTGPCFGYYYTKYTYDHMNRLTREEDIYPSGISLAICHKYDALGYRIATTDIYGNETRFVNDEQGRVTETHYPPVQDENQNFVHPMTITNYDILGNPVLIIDPKGGQTRTAYTIRGQPYLITYPDGSTERYEYSIDGFLQKAYAKNGTCTAYTLDYLGRPVWTETYSPTGELLTTTNATYSHFHLLSETDAAGNLTTYRYHMWGALAEIVKGNNKTTYHYDALFRLIKTCEYIDQDHCHVKAQEYDLLNRVIEERTEDEAGKVFSKINYAYDIYGNKSQVTTYNQAGTNNTSITYNAYHQPEITIDAEGNRTHNGFHYYWRNIHGQQVACEDLIDSLGNKTRTIFDTIGRIASVSIYNPYGDMIQSQERYYDMNSNLSRVIDVVIKPNVPNKTITSLLQYDNCNRLIKLQEAVGTHQERHTSYVYNSMVKRYGRRSLTEPSFFLLIMPWDFL